MSRASLQERWRTEGGRLLAEEVLATLVANRDLGRVDGLGSHEGMVDLRGFPAPPPERLRSYEAAGWWVQPLKGQIVLRGARLEGLDLSGANLSGFRLMGSRVAGCRLDGARCDDWRMWKCEFEDTTFVGTDLRGATIGSRYKDGKRNSWRQVDFSEADLRGAVIQQAKLDVCVFSDTRLDGVQFVGCEISRSSFAGPLHRVVFDGRHLPGMEGPPPLELFDVDFSNATLDQVEFAGYTLRDVGLPPDPDLMVIPHIRCVAREGLGYLGDDQRPESRSMRALLERQLRGPGTEQDAYLFNRRDYVAMRGETLADLATSTFTHAMKRCATPTPHSAQDRFVRWWFGGFALAESLIASSALAIASGTPIEVLGAAVGGAIVGFLLALGAADLIVLAGGTVGLDEDGRRLQRIRRLVRRLDDLVGRARG